MGIAFFTDGDAGNDWLVIPLNQSNATTSYEHPHLVAYATDGDNVWINAAPLAPGGHWKLNQDLRQGGGEVEIAHWTPQTPSTSRSTSRSASPPPDRPATPPCRARP